MKGTNIFRKRSVQRKGQREWKTETQVDSVQQKKKIDSPRKGNIKKEKKRKDLIT